MLDVQNFLDVGESQHVLSCLKNLFAPTYELSRSGSFQGHSGISGVVRELFGGRSAIVRGLFEIFSKKFN